MLQKISRRIMRSTALVIFSLTLCLGLAATNPLHVKADDLPVVYKSGTLEADETWAAGNVYVAAGVVVPHDVTLTIQAGAIVKSGGPVDSILVTDGGSLDIAGSSANRVVFTSINDDSFGGDSNGNGPSTGSYGDYSNSVNIGSGGTASISYASLNFGSRSVSVNCGTDTSLVLSDSLVNSEFDMSGCGSDMVSLERNTFDLPSSSGYAIQSQYSDPAGIKLWGTDKNTFTGSGRQVTVLLQHNEVATGSNWVVSGATGATLYVADLEVSGEMSVGEGAVLKYSPYFNGITVDLGATFNATGTSTVPVVFTSIKDDSIAGDSGGDGATTAYYSEYSAAVAVGGGTVNVTHSKFSYGTKAITIGCSISLLTHVTANDNLFESGVDLQYCDNGVATMQRNQFQVPADYQGIPLDLIYSGIEGISLSGSNKNTFVGNDIGRQRTLRWYSSTVPDGTAVAIAGDTGATLAVRNINVEGTLNLNLGLLVKILPGSYSAFNLTSGGVIDVNGTSTSHVTITSGLDDAIGGESLGDGTTTPSAGDSAAFISMSDDSTVTAAYVDIKYTSAAFSMSGGEGDINHVTISDVNNGIYATSAGNFNAKDTTIEDSAVGIDANSQATVTYRGKLQGISDKYIKACAWDGDCMVDATYTDWGDSYGPYDSNGDARFCGQVWVGPWKDGGVTHAGGTWEASCGYTDSPTLTLYNAADQYDNFAEALDFDCSNAMQDACDKLNALQTCYSDGYNSAANASEVSIPQQGGFSTANDFSHSLTGTLGDAVDDYADPDGISMSAFKARVLQTFTTIKSFHDTFNNCVAQNQ